MFFDTHVHFDSFVKEGSLASVLERADSAQVLRMLAVGGSVEANALSLKLANEFPQRIFGSVGYDRDLAGVENDLALLREQATRSETVAIGETGLDYFYEPEKATEQKELFSQLQQKTAPHPAEAITCVLAFLVWLFLTSFLLHRWFDFSDTLRITYASLSVFSFFVWFVTLSLV